MRKGKVTPKSKTPSCSISKGVLLDPVVLPCGHDICEACLEGTSKCSKCRRTMPLRRPRRNKKNLAELVEDMKKFGLQTKHPAGPDDVACDSCTGRKIKAVKSCLVCLVSFCERHLQPHLEEPGFRRHDLVQPSKQLQEMVCSLHNEVKKMFCRTDGEGVCSLCLVDQHKDHEMVLAAAERSERQNEVDQSLGSIQQKITELEVAVKQLQQEVKGIGVSADEASKDSQEVLNGMIQILKRKMTDVEQQIRSRERAETIRVRGLQEQLEQQIQELKKKEAELKQLLNTNINIIFLQNLTSLSGASKDLLSPQTDDHRCFEKVAAAVSASRDRLHDFLIDACTEISLTLPLKTRSMFLRYSQDITLDPHTAHSQMKLSEGNRKVTNMGKDQSPPHHADRFKDYLQVLSLETLMGRCYWEVDWCGEVQVAIANENVSRSGGESLFGSDANSWSLCCRNTGCSFRQNGVTIQVSTVRPPRVGVYLDHSAGLLSFWSVSETMTLLHRVQTMFAHPLLAGFWVCSKSTCEFHKLPESA